MITIRKGTINDLEQIAILFDEYRQFYAQKSDVEKGKAFLKDRITNNESIIFVAEKDEQLIGFIQLYPTFSSVSLQPDIIMNDLYVFPKERKQGIGKALLDTAKQFVIDNGYKGIWIETANDNPARFLYESLSWEKDVAFTNYYWQV
ncbi:MAG: GNAT family N-acetyltransferase [Chitinophagales bacterium]|nr:GNAT family N-acetyltransferase [Chitinophagales bacterium]